MSRLVWYWSVSCIFLTTYFKFGGQIYFYIYIVILYRKITYRFYFQNVGLSINCSLCAIVNNTGKNAEVATVDRMINQHKVILNWNNFSLKRSNMKRLVKLLKSYENYLKNHCESEVCYNVTINHSFMQECMVWYYSYWCMNTVL